MRKDNRGREKKDVPLCEIKDMYLMGDSVLKISKHFSVSRDTIHRRLSEMGIEQRTKSQAAYNRMSKLTEDERKKITSNANLSVTGKKLNSSIHKKRALTLQEKPYEHYIGIGEVEFKNLLDLNGIDYVWQKAESIYSIDFMIGNVAVELRKARNDRGYTGIKKGRTKFLRENGIITFFVSFEDVDCLRSQFKNIIQYVNDLKTNGISDDYFATFSCLWSSKVVLRNSKGQFYSEEIPLNLKSSYKTIKFQ